MRQKYPSPVSFITLDTGNGCGMNLKKATAKENVISSLSGSSRAAFLKLWSADYLRSTRNTLVVLEKWKRKIKLKLIVYHTIA